MKPEFSVCFAEDEPLMRSYISNNLSQIHGDYYVKDVASNGEEALKLLDDHTYDLFITDIKMPLVSGLEVVKKMRKTGSELPVLLLTGYDDFAYAKEAIKLGVMEYILKPLNDQEMHDALEKIKEHICERRNTVVLPDDSTPNEITQLILSRFTASAQGDDSLAQKAVDYISAHYTENISQGEVADALGVSPSYLSGIFHEETGESYSRFITRLRMTQAAVLLRTEQNLPIREIAQQVGYFSEKHFMSVFKTFYGITPSEYRNN
ncbi:MAG: response regulator [Lachnospiraceae bacterium]|nr:response regulator [Lachnospiraceae bacterium]